MITITKKRPAYQRFFIRGLDGVRRHVEVASIPIAGLDGDFLGGAALFLGSFGLMRVTLFGTRGSLAAPGAETNRYGGNTSTVEVCANDGTLLVLDAGTGIRRLAKQIPLAIARIDILLTHLHMDHIQGLGFFGRLL